MAASMRPGTLASDAQVRGEGPGVGAQRGGGALEDDPALVDHVDPGGQDRGQLDVLLDQQHGAPLALELGDGADDGLDDEGGEPLRGLVQEDQAGASSTGPTSA